MKANIGFNCRRQPTGAILSAIDRTNAGIVLISDEPGQANEIVAARPDVLVVAREYKPSGGDDNLHTKEWSAADWVNYMMSRGYDPRVVWNVGNEPTHRLEDLANWTLEAIEHADRVGRSLCVLNFALLNPAAHHWTTTLAPVLKALANNKHYLGLHEYHWWNKPQWAGNPVGYYKEVYKACDFLGVDYPRILITESGVERDPLDNHGGWLDCGMSPDEFADLMLAIHREYAKDGIASCLFSLGQWNTHDMDNNYDVWPAMDALAARTWPTWERDTAPVPEPQPEPEPVIPHNPDLPISNRRNFLTYNVTSVAIDREPGQRQWLEDWIEDTRPAGLMVMNALGEAVKYKDRWPDMFVWARMAPMGGDGSQEEIEERGGHERLIDQFREETGGRDIAYAIVNEIHTTDEHGAWMYDVVDYANRVGQRLVVGEFGIAQSIKMWHRGSPWADVARLMETSTPRHAWGFHEYMDCGTWQYSGPDPETGQIVNYDPMRGGNFMVGNAVRHARFLLDNYGIDMRNNGVVFGEVGFDTERQRPCGPYGFTAAPQGAEYLYGGCTPMKGYRDAYCPPDAAWVDILERGEWPVEWIPKRVAWANMHGALHHVWKAKTGDYADWWNLYIAGAWYMLGGGMAYDNDGQPIAPGEMWGMDIWGNEVYRKQHRGFSVGVQDMKTYKNISVDSIRVRSAPTLKGDHVRWIAPGDTVTLDENSEVLADSYYWLQHEDGNWSAWRTATDTVYLEPQAEEPQEPPVDPPPDPDPEPEPGDTVTRAEFEAVVAELRNLISAVPDNVALLVQQEVATQLTPEVDRQIDLAMQPVRDWAEYTADGLNTLAGMTEEEAVELVLESGEKVMAIIVSTDKAA